ncbi:Retrovirus-related Pol polyprotein from transposon 17.6, partial [Frankliniella fusca]
MPIPRVGELLQHIGGKKLYHSFDLAHGYHNLEVHPDDQPKTAIILPEDLGLPHRQYEYTRLGFGLSAAPGAFQYVADRLVTPAEEPNPTNDLGPTVVAYIDDICIAGEPFQEMLQRLQAFFNRVRARASRFLLKAKKCELFPWLFQKEIPFLGHIVFESGIKTDGNKIEKVVHWPIPENLKELRTWLGMVNYYTKYIPQMTTIAAPLYHLLKKGVEYHWSEECNNAFEKIKKQMTTAPILGSPDPSKGPFTLTTDCSLTGMGAVLTQEQG